MNYVAYKDKDGNALDVKEWSDLFEERDYRLIAHTEIDKFRVSTVWLGILDLNGNYFETGIFGPDCKLIDLIRYSSLPEALLGHEAEVYRVKTNAL